MQGCQFYTGSNKHSSTFLITSELTQTWTKGSFSHAFLCGVCMFSPCSQGVCMFSMCSQGVSSTKNPTEKHAKRTEHSCTSLTKTDGSLGPRALKSCPLLLGGPGRRTVRDGKKAE